VQSNVAFIANKTCPVTVDFIFYSNVFCCLRIC